jgi:hypothetical protein
LAANLEKIQAFLLKKSKSIAGKNNQPAIQAGLNEGFDGPLLPTDPTSPTLRYEDGTIPTLTTVRDPETDQRNA